MSKVRQLLVKVLAQHRLLTGAAYLAAFVSLCIFPSFDRKTEVEEHGLLPGYNTAGFHGKWASSLKSVIADLERRPDPADALHIALTRAGLVPHLLNFTAPGGQRSSLTYTLVRSARGDSREALVVVIAANYTDGPQGSSWGLGVGVVLAEYLRSVTWLAKDVFFVFLDGSLPYGAGARMWLETYFDGATAVRAGSLRQAVVLDMPSQPTALLSEVEGINGMVPNQDLVNTYMREAVSYGLAIKHRNVWESLFYHFKNGGVHSSHAAFLESHVPAFTVRGSRGKAVSSGKAINDPELVAQSLEAVLRSCSNNLQQLHHSFNFYFFTGLKRHISSGLYLYPVFGMQLPLLSFLGTAPAFRDIRSLLIGLSAITVIVLIGGGTIFLMGTNAELMRALQGLFPGSADGYGPPGCALPGDRLEAEQRLAVSAWLTTGLASSLVVLSILRRYAFSVYDEAGPKQDRKGSLKLPSPLWDAVRCAGLFYLMVLAPVTICSWALAVPLTIVCVPALVLVRPFSLRHRPVRSTLMAAFLAANVFLLAVRPEVRAELLADVPAKAAREAFDFYFKTVVPAVPRNARHFLPTLLVKWCQGGQLGSALSADLLQGLFEAARDWNCVGGMLFPVFCFVYYPFLILLALVGFVLPPQRVEDDGLTMRQFRLGVLAMILILVGGLVGGVVWRSVSSKGLGDLEW